MILLQIIGIVLLTVGISKLLFVRGAIRKGFRTVGTVVQDKNQASKSRFTNHPKVAFEDQKGRKLKMELKVSKSFIDIHAKENLIDIIYHEGRILHPNEIYSSLIIPGFGLLALIIGWYL